MYCVCCEVRTEFICYVEESRPPLWSSGQSSWLRIQRSRVRFPALPVVDLERCPLSLVSVSEKLLGRNSSGSGLKIRQYGFGDSSHWPRDTFNPRTLALTSPTSWGHSVGIVRSQTTATEFVFIVFKSESWLITTTQLVWIFYSTLLCTEMCKAFMKRFQYYF
jgi:hypothetical protein